MSSVRGIVTMFLTRDLLHNSAVKTVLLRNIILMYAVQPIQYLESSNIVTICLYSISSSKEVLKAYRGTIISIRRGFSISHLKNNISKVLQLVKLDQYWSRQKIVKGLEQLKHRHS